MIDPRTQKRCLQQLVGVNMLVLVGVNMLVRTFLGPCSYQGALGASSTPGGHTACAGSPAVVRRAAPARTAATRPRGACAAHWR